MMESPAAVPPQLAHGPPEARDAEDLDLAEVPEDPAIARLWRWDLYFSIAFGLVLGLNLVAIWGTRWFPLGDLAPWLALAESPAPSSLSLEPGTFTLHLAHALSALIPADLSAKLFLSWYLVGTPLALLAVCDAFVRSRWLVFAAVPLLWNPLVSMDSALLLFALPLFLLTLALCRAFSRFGLFGHGVALGFSFLLLLYAHLPSFFAAAAAFGLFLAFEGPRHLPRLWALLPAGALYALWALGPELGLSLPTSPLSLPPTEAEGPTLWGLLSREVTLGVAAVVTLAWLGLIALSQHEGDRRARPEGPVEYLRLFSLELLTGAFILASVLSVDAPEHLATLALVTALLLALWPRLPLQRCSAQLLIGPVVALAIATPLWIHWQLHHHTPTSAPARAEILPPPSVPATPHTFPLPSVRLRGSVSPP